jgi:hypothetical protein
MSNTSKSTDSSTVWVGDIIAGGIRTENWSAELKATRDRIVLSGPMGLRYELARDQVEEIRASVGRFFLWSWIMKKCVTIQHAQSGILSPLAFQTRRTTSVEILSRLKTLGFNIKTV